MIGIILFAILLVGLAATFSGMQLGDFAHPFHRVHNCFGLTLWVWRKRVELWFCFGEVPDHAHPGQHVEIVPLFGWTRFFRVDPDTDKWWPDRYHEINVDRAKWFRRLSIPAGWWHGFSLQRRPLVFLNITTGRSAAENFAT